MAARQITLPELNLATPTTPATLAPLLYKDEQQCYFCRATTSVRKGSFFERSHLPVHQLLELMYLWAYDVPQVEAQVQVN